MYTHIGRAQFNAMVEITTLDQDSSRLDLMRIGSAAAEDVFACMTRLATSLFQDGPPLLKPVHAFVFSLRQSSLPPASAPSPPLLTILSVCSCRFVSFLNTPST